MILQIYFFYFDEDQKKFIESLLEKFRFKVYSNGSISWSSSFSENLSEAGEFKDSDSQDFYSSRFIRSYSEIMSILRVSLLNNIGEKLRPLSATRLDYCRWLVPKTLSNAELKDFEFHSKKRKATKPLLNLLPANPRSSPNSELFVLRVDIFPTPTGMVMTLEIDRNDVYSSIKSLDLTNCDFLVDGYNFLVSPLNLHAKIMFSNKKTNKDSHIQDNPLLSLNSNIDPDDILPKSFIKDASNSYMEFFLLCDKRINPESYFDSSEMVFVQLMGSSSSFLYPSELIFINQKIYEKSKQFYECVKIQQNKMKSSPDNEENIKEVSDLVPKKLPDSLRNQLPSLLEISNSMSDIKKEVKSVSDYVSNSIPTMLNLINDNESSIGDQLSFSPTQNPNSSKLYNELIGHLANKVDGQDNVFTSLNFNVLNEKHLVNNLNNQISNFHDLNNTSNTIEKNKTPPDISDKLQSPRKKIKTEHDSNSDISKLSDKKNSRKSKSVESGAIAKLSFDAKTEKHNHINQSQNFTNQVNGLSITLPDISNTNADELSPFTELSLDLDFKMDVDIQNESIGFNTINNIIEYKDPEMYDYDTFEMGLNDTDFNFFDNPPVSNFSSIVPDSIQIKPIKPLGSEKLLNGLNTNKYPNDILHSFEKKSSTPKVSPFIIDTSSIKASQNTGIKISPMDPLNKGSNNVSSKNTSPVLDSSLKNQYDFGIDDGLFDDYFDTNFDEEPEIISEDNSKEIIAQDNLTLGEVKDGSPEFHASDFPDPNTIFIENSNNSPQELSSVPTIIPEPLLSENFSGHIPSSEIQHSLETKTLDSVPNVSPYEGLDLDLDHSNTLWPDSIQTLNAHSPSSEESHDVQEFETSSKSDHEIFALPESASLIQISKQPSDIYLKSDKDDLPFDLNNGARDALSSRYIPKKYRPIHLSSKAKLRGLTFSHIFRKFQDKSYLGDNPANPFGLNDSLKSVENEIKFANNSKTYCFPKNPNHFTSMNYPNVNYISNNNDFDQFQSPPLKINNKEESTYVENFGFDTNTSIPSYSTKKKNYSQFYDDRDLHPNSFSIGENGAYLPLQWVSRMNKRKINRKARKTSDKIFFKGVNSGFNNYTFWAHYQDSISNYNSLPTYDHSINPFTSSSRTLLYSQKSKTRSNNQTITPKISSSFNSINLDTVNREPNYNMDSSDYKNEKKNHFGLYPKDQVFEEGGLAQIILTTQKMPSLFRIANLVINSIVVKSPLIGSLSCLGSALIQSLELKVLDLPKYLQVKSNEDYKISKPSKLVNTEFRSEEKSNHLSVRDDTELYNTQGVQTFISELGIFFSSFEKSTDENYNSSISKDEHISKISSIIAEWASSNAFTDFVNNELGTLKNSNLDLPLGTTDFDFQVEFLSNFFEKNHIWRSSVSPKDKSQLEYNRNGASADSYEKITAENESDTFFIKPISILRFSSLAFNYFQDSDKFPKYEDVEKWKNRDSINKADFQEEVSFSSENDHSETLSFLIEPCSRHQIVVGLRRNNIIDNTKASNISNNGPTSINCDISTSNSFNLGAYSDYLINPQLFRSKRSRPLITDSLISNFESTFGQRNVHIDSNYKIDINKTLEDVLELAKYPRNNDCHICSGTFFSNDHNDNGSSISNGLEIFENNKVFKLSDSVVLGPKTFENQLKFGINEAEDGKVFNDNIELFGITHKSSNEKIPTLNPNEKASEFSKKLNNTFQSSAINQNSIVRDDITKSCLSINPDNLASDGVEEGEEVESDSDEEAPNDTYNHNLSSNSVGFDVNIVPTDSKSMSSIKDGSNVLEIDKELKTLNRSQFTYAGSIINYTDSEFYNLIEPECSTNNIELSNTDFYSEKQFISTIDSEAILFWENLPLRPIGGPKSLYYFSISNYKSATHLKDYLKNVSHFYSSMRFGHHKPLSVSNLFPMYHWNFQSSKDNNGCFCCRDINPTKTKDPFLEEASSSIGSSEFSNPHSKFDLNDTSISLDKKISSFFELLDLSKSLGSLLADIACAIYSNSLELDDTYSHLTLNLELPPNLILAKKVLSYTYNTSISNVSTSNIVVYLNDDIFESQSQYSPISMSCLNLLVELFYTKSWNITKFSTYFPKIKLFFEFISVKSEISMDTSILDSPKNSLSGFDGFRAFDNKKCCSSYMNDYNAGISLCWRLYERLPSPSNSYSNSILRNKKLNLGQLDLKKVLKLHSTEMDLKKPAIFLSSPFQFGNSQKDIFLCTNPHNGKKSLSIKGNSGLDFKSQLRLLSTDQILNPNSKLDVDLTKLSTLMQSVSSSKPFNIPTRSKYITPNHILTSLSRNNINLFVSSGNLNLNSSQNNSEKSEMKTKAITELKKLLGILGPKLKNAILSLFHYKTNSHICYPHIHSKTMHVSYSTINSKIGSSNLKKQFICASWCTENADFIDSGIYDNQSECSEKKDEFFSNDQISKLNMETIISKCLEFKCQYVNSFDDKANTPLRIVINKIGGMQTSEIKSWEAFLLKIFRIIDLIRSCDFNELKSNSEVWNSFMDEYNTFNESNICPEVKKTNPDSFEFECECSPIILSEIVLLGSHISSHTDDIFHERSSFIRDHDFLLKRSCHSRSRDNKINAIGSHGKDGAPGISSDSNSIVQNKIILCDYPIPIESYNPYSYLNLSTNKPKSESHFIQVTDDYNSTRESESLTNDCSLCSGYIIICEKIKSKKKYCQPFDSYNVDGVAIETTTPKTPLPGPRTMKLNAYKKIKTMENNKPKSNVFDSESDNNSENSKFTEEIKFNEILKLEMYGRLEHRDICLLNRSNHTKKATNDCVDKKNLDKNFSMSSHLGGESGIVGGVSFASPPSDIPIPKSFGKGLEDEKLIYSSDGDSLRTILHQFQALLEISILKDSLMSQRSSRSETEDQQQFTKNSRGIFSKLNLNSDIDNVNKKNSNLGIRLPLPMSIVNKISITIILLFSKM
ncbi:hypothetical protein AYI68_g6937 [Smittium mucronatum]|uniref:Mediator of RNA polymerase II transcription subunit 13 n=1 Tax=Smittium mucronatum TaxID=133383 RepID=A0A1R0GQ33_9FUNG|nr:hypothetical protein AYI68_g6937 [Smittium mucronatum]